MRIPASDYWLEFVTIDTLCGLCHNKGMVQLYNGESRPCICPNGRALKEVTKPTLGELIEELGEIPTNKRPNVKEALEVAFQFGSTDGGHHKMWVIDQMVRHLTGVNYEKWVKEVRSNDEGEDGVYDWDEGIAP